jgi:ribosomal protein L32
MDESRKSRLEAVRAALTAAGVSEPSCPALVATYELTQGDAATRAFWEEVFESGFSEVVSDGWPCDSSDVGDGSTFRVESPWGVSGVFRSEHGIALAVLEGGELRLRVAAKSRDDVAAAVLSFRDRFPFAAPATDDLVPVTFWSYGKFGAQSYTRRVAVQPWAEIDGNYTAGVRDQLASMMTGFEPAKGGQLLLWQGPPGTGKTWALRALASEWSSWADFHYIVDPDAFFGEHADYMVEVLLRESFSYEGDEPEEKWRLLVLEDTGELLSADAKEKSGQALSRLLNVVDGLIGQGLRVLVLVTTNDEITAFHPAVSRPGRCAAQIEFAPLSPEEAAKWLGSDADAPATLAELYARNGTEPADASLTSDAAPNLGGEMETETATTPDAERLVALAAQANGMVKCPDCGAMGPPGGKCPDCGADIPKEAASLASDLGVVPAADVRPDANPEAVVDLPEQRTNASQTRWEGVLVVEDTITEDGRYITPGATTWRELPLSLAAMVETQEGHTGAVVCGRIDEIWREGNLIMGKGVFDESEFGMEIARQVDERVLRGNSVDLAVREFELAPRSDFDEAGHRTGETDSEGDPLEMLYADEKPVFVFLDCVIGMSTVCPFPAFADASISVTASALEWKATRQASFVIVRTEEEAVEDVEVIVASAAAVAEQEDVETTAPLNPPAEWFAAPEFKALTPLTVTEDGRVFGHFAQWDTCHIGIPDVCTTAPSSMTNYSYFHLGEVETESGERVACGKITLGMGHAAKHLGRQAASEHYDNVDACVADVVAGEDTFGPWIVGALRPGLSAERIRDLRAAVLSGDWRNVNGNLELVGLLAVNVPGFPVPRSARALVAAGEDGTRVLSLVAAGTLDRADFTQDEQDRLSGLALVAEGGLEALAATVAA